MRAYQFSTSLHNKLPEQGLIRNFFTSVPLNIDYLGGVGSFSQGRQQPGAEFNVIYNGLFLIMDPTREIFSSRNLRDIA
jgi:hypothetical protein